MVIPSKLEGVKSALAELGTSGLAIMEVMSFRHQNGYAEIYCGSECVVFCRKLKLKLCSPTRNLQ
jgi:nitrogen regulatory protein PII